MGSIGRAARGCEPKLESWRALAETTHLGAIVGTEDVVSEMKRCQLCGEMEFKEVAKYKRTHPYTCARI